MAHGLFITDKVTVGVVASVCQCPSARNPLTVSLAQVVGTALPYDKHSLVEGRWTRARHPKDTRQWKEQLLDLGACMACFILLCVWLLYDYKYGFTDIVLKQLQVLQFCLLLMAQKLHTLPLKKLFTVFPSFSIELLIGLMSLCKYSFIACVIHHLTDFFVC